MSSSLLLSRLRNPQAKSKATAALSVVVMMGGLLSGCSFTTDNPDVDSPSQPIPQATAQDGTVFSGPYASEFAEAYDEAESDQAREALSDGIITPEELQALKTVFVGCVQNQGIVVVYVNDDGSMEFEAREDADGLDPDTIVTQCDASSGWGIVGPLAHFIKVNPENIDTAIIIAECLVRVGVQPKGYSAENYIRESEDGTLGNILNSDSPTRDKYLACFQDPAHAS